MSDDETSHLANCPVARNEPGACLGCADILGDAAKGPPACFPVPKPKSHGKKKPKSAYERAQNANYMRDRRQRPKRIAGEDFRYDSVDHLPPIEVDMAGFAKRPPTPPEAWKYNFTLEQRKVRFLLYWNYAGGNWTVACQFAGVPRHVADEWVKTDARIPPLLERAKAEIADRVRLRLMQVAGLVSMPKDVAVNTTTLLAVAKEYGVELAPRTPEVDAPPAEVTTGSPAGQAGISTAVGGIPRPGA